MSQVASTGRSDTVLTIIDVRRAYFYAAAQRRVFIELPAEDYRQGDEQMCGLLCASLYGTRDAAKNWEAELGGYLQQLGLKKGLASPCLYSTPNGDLCVAVHGDDMTCSGSRQDSEWLLAKMKERYEVKE